MQDGQLTMEVKNYMGVLEWLLLPHWDVWLSRLGCLVQVSKLVPSLNGVRQRHPFPG